MKAREFRLNMRNFGFLCFIIVTSAVQITGIINEGGRDSWATALISIVFALPLCLIFGRLVKTFKGMNIFDMIHAVFGGKWGKIITFAYAFYFTHLTSLIIFSNASFVKTNILTKTPFLAVGLIFFLPAVFVAKISPRLMGKWGMLVFASAAIMIVFNTALSVPMMKLENLLPVFERPIGQIALKGVGFITYPYGELLLMLTVTHKLDQNCKTSATRVFGLSIVLGGLYMALIAVRSVAVLGPHFFKHVANATIKSVSVLKVSTFLQRFETITAMILLLFGVIKSATALRGAAEGLTSLFGGKEGRFVPVAAAVALGVCPLLFSNYNEILGFIKGFYIFYAIPFQIIIPLLMIFLAKRNALLVEK